MPAESFTIGRSDECDIVIDHTQVSRIHAFVEQGDECYLLSDNDSSNGTYLNTTDNPVAYIELKPDDIIFLSKNFSIPARLLIRQLQEERHPDNGVQLSTTQELIRIGRDASNDLVLHSLHVAACQTEINNHNSKRTIRDIQRSSKTSVNGQMISTQPVEIHTNDIVEIAGTKISFDFSQTDSQISVAATTQGLYLSAQNISWQAGREPLLILDNINFAVLPGEVLGLLGPSGSGKTSLLEILCGAKAPSSGDILLEGISLSETTNSRRKSQIGYVPQDNILYAELTVREMMYYQAKLRFPPTTTDTDIHELIEKLCNKLLLSDTIDTLIGSTANKTLSGGQRKRVSLALELLSDPSILFLDEPTSGLSSRDARIVMELLRDVALDYGVAVVLTIHQPSPNLYRILDTCAYLKAGNLCYFGPAYPESFRYFVPEADPGNASPDIIMERLEELETSESRSRFNASEIHDNFLGQRQRSLSTRSTTEQRGRPQKLSALNHTMLLMRRQCNRLVRSKFDLAAMTLQATLIGSLFGYAFSGKFPLNTQVFLLTFIAIWLGTNNAARLIVSDRVMFLHERRSGVRTSAYLCSLFVIQLIICVFQNAVVLGLVLPFTGLNVSFINALAVVTAAGICGISIGLLISSWSKTEVVALVVVPLVLVPYILVGGLMIRFNTMSELLKSLSFISPSKWSYESLLALEHMAINSMASEMQQDLSEAAREFGQPAILPFSAEYKDLDNDTLLARAALGTAILAIQSFIYLSLTYIKLKFYTRSN